MDQLTEFCRLFAGRLLCSAAVVQPMQERSEWNLLASQMVFTDKTGFSRYLLTLEMQSEMRYQFDGLPSGQIQPRSQYLIDCAACDLEHIPLLKEVYVTS